MYAYAVVVAIGHEGVAFAKGGDINDGIRCGHVGVRVNVIEKFGEMDHGTGSYPLPPHG
jgi:hypothetical protein